MARFRPPDLSIVIPTRDRWSVLRRTLDALEAQTVSGFEIVVVVDGEDQRPPPLGKAHTVVKPRAGPGAARNVGAASTDRPLLLFLGDDMVPSPRLVESHLDRHGRHPEAEVAVLGRIEWHPEVASGSLMRWLDWSGVQFDFRSIDKEEAGFGRFYSSNVSLKRSLFTAAGGFDEGFVFDYEDLDLGWRLHGHGMRLFYEPAAVASHLHGYDLAALQRRFTAHGRGERRMATKHEWFDPFFASRIHHAEGAAPVSALWPAVLGHLPAGLAGSRPARAVQTRADRWYFRHLARAFLDGWEAERDLEELQSYLGEAYDHRRLVDHRGEVEREAEKVGDEDTFYRTSEAYLYDLTAFAMSATKSPYLADLRRLVPRGARVLDYGCGIGSDGLRLLDSGYSVAFADFDSPSMRYLRWRLTHRCLEAPVYDLDREEVPGGFDAAFAFDVIEHVADPFELLVTLEQRAALVMVNLLDDTEEPDHATHLHRPLPIRRLLDHAGRRGLLRYRIYHGRSHLIAYRGTAPSTTVGRIRSPLERQIGQRRRVGAGRARVHT